MYADDTSLKAFGESLPSYILFVFIVLFTLLLSLVNISFISYVDSGPHCKTD